MGEKENFVNALASFLLAGLVECRYLLLEGFRHRLLLSTVAVQAY